MAGNQGNDGGFESGAYGRYVVPLLRLEGLATLGLSVVLYQMLDAGWVTFAVLFLWPDLSFFA